MAGATLRVGLPDTLRDDAAALYLDAFGAKLGPLLGRDDRALRFLVAVMRPDLCIAAIDGDGGLLGVAGFHLDGASFIGGDVSDLRRAYGALGALWRAPLLALFERAPAPEEMLMDGVVVAPAARGRGIGGALIEELAMVARDKGFTRMRLEVVDANPRARALYLRRGFVTQSVRRAPYLRPLFGFGASETIVRPLAVDHEPPP